MSARSARAARRSAPSWRRSSSHNLTLALGPAGTGKTYLAIAAAVEALESRPGRPHRAHPGPRSRRARRLGFLPGDLEDKLAPYLRPLYDALAERLGGSGCAR